MGVLSIVTSSPNMKPARVPYPVFNGIRISFLRPAQQKTRVSFAATHSWSLVVTRSASVPRNTIVSFSGRFAPVFNPPSIDEQCTLTPARSLKVRHSKSSAGMFSDSRRDE